MTFNIRISEPGHFSKIAQCFDRIGSSSDTLITVIFDSRTIRMMLNNNSVDPIHMKCQWTIEDSENMESANRVGITINVRLFSRALANVSADPFDLEISHEQIVLVSKRKDVQMSQAIPVDGFVSTSFESLENPWNKMASTICMTLFLDFTDLDLMRTAVDRLKYKHNRVQIRGLVIQPGRGALSLTCSSITVDRCTRIDDLRVVEHDSGGKSSESVIQVSVKDLLGCFQWIQPSSSISLGIGHHNILKIGMEWESTIITYLVPHKAS